MASFGAWKEEQEKGQQGSLCSLTQGEIQNTILGSWGKNFRSMSMDEFLASIFNMEEGVDFTTIDSKTIEQVWAEIGLDQQKSTRSNEVALTPDPQPTLDEMTIEDFLVKVGIFQPATTEFEDPMEFYEEEGRMGNGYGFMSWNIGSPTRSVLSEGGVVMETYLTPEGTREGRNRLAPEEDRVENRNERRMRKNRESAARSRARKEAYTKELEVEIGPLREKKDILKEEYEELKIRFLKNMDKNARARKVEVKMMGVLRRCSSCHW